MLRPTLHLCHSVGELVVMLAQYTRYRIDTFMTQKVDHTASSLSYVHSYLSPKDWMKLHRLICRSDDRKLLHIWVRMFSLNFHTKRLLNTWVQIIFQNFHTNLMIESYMTQDKNDFPKFHTNLLIQS